MKDIWLIVISFLYIFVIIGIAGILSKKYEKELSRKFIHIMVGNWIFIAYFYSSLWAALFVPGAFVLINSLSLKYNLVSSMERNDDSLGTVYYAVSLCIAVLIRFLTKWEAFPFISILIMAYGDGLAALFGQKYGKRPSFSFAPKKSLVGSATVAIVGFWVTFFSLLFLGGKEITTVNILHIFFLSLLTALLSSFVEASGTKGCDNFSLPLSAGLFACLSFYYGSFGFYLYILFTVGILLLSLKLRLLTADGVVAAVMTATTLYLLGSPWLALSLHGFYLLGSSVSKVKNERKRNANRLQESTGARTWVQVVCNSLPASILVWFSYFFPKYPIFALLAFAVFSAAAADTFSSELGTLSKAQVFDIITGKKVNRGLSGGVSFPGLIAGLVGSLLLSLFALPQFGLTGMIFVAAIGFLGTLIDSVLGALFQRKYISASGELSDKAFEIGQKPTQGFYWISNNTVNFLSLLLVSLIGHLANLLYRVV